jgi:DoxX-like protein
MEMEEDMPATTQSSSASKTSVWSGRIISALVVIFLLFDSTIKVLKLAAAVEGTVQAGYPATTVQPIGIVLLVCILLYVIPRTSILGAIVLTGYLGGATATMVRISNPWFLFPVVVGVLAWLGIFLRDERLRTLIPLRSSAP